MIEYHLVQEGLLVGHGRVQRGSLASVHVPEGARLVVGPAPPVPSTRPSPEALWSLVEHAWVEPARPPGAAWAIVRSQRDRLLAETDWVTLRAQEQGTPVPPEWLAYRQALRDITEQPDPLEIVWPEPPGGSQ